MSFGHSKDAYFALDDLDGSIQNISSVLRSAGGLVGSTARSPTPVFGTHVRRQVKGRRDGGPIALAGGWQAAGGTFVHAKETRILFDTVALHGYLNSGTFRRSVGLPATTVFGKNWIPRGVVGRMDGGVSFSGLFDGDANAIDAQFRTAMDQDAGVLVSVGYAGFALGSLVDIVRVVQGNYQITTPEGDVAGVSGDFENDDRADMGVSLHDHTAEVSTGTVNYTSVDETEQTTEGWVAFLHVSAFSGWTSVNIKIQDSADNSAWADLTGAAFASVSGATKERLEGAATATVRRYVRAVATMNGASGSITFQVTLARRGYAYGSAGTYRHMTGLYGRAASSTFQYGPQGSASGKRRVTGESRLESLETQFADDLVMWNANLVTDDTLTFDTF